MSKYLVEEVFNQEDKVVLKCGQVVLYETLKATVNHSTKSYFSKVPFKEADRVERRMEACGGCPLVEGSEHR